MGKHQDSQEAEGLGVLWTETLLWFPQDRQTSEGGAGIGLASVNNFSGLWGQGAVRSSLAPDPELIRARKSNLECKADKAGGWGLSCGQIGLHIGELTGQLPQGIS